MLYCKQADTYLSSYTEGIKKKRRGLIILFVTLISMTIVITVDIIVWMETADKLRSKKVDTRKCFISYSRYLASIFPPHSD